MLAVLAWGVLSVIALVAVGQESLRAATADFERRAEAIYVGLHDRLQVNEAALFGFASLLAALPGDDLRTPRQLAEALMRQYPGTHRFQVARQVAHAELPQFTAQARRLLHRDFRLRGLAPEDTSARAPVPENDFYFPLVFVHPPERPEASSLGLDLGTVPFLEKRLQEAGLKERLFVTPIYPSPDGAGSVFALFRAVPHPDNGSLLGGTLYALLVVPVAGLQPDLAERDRQVGYFLRHRGYGETVHGDAIFDLPARPASALESWLLPRLVFSRDFADVEQPFRLTLERQLRLGDLLTPGVLGVALLAGLTLAALVFHMLSQERLRRRIHAQEEQIRHLALHDQLTGLPNRRLLEDRLQRALELARRQGERVGVIFVDIDAFKQVNDHFGHRAGDAVLQLAGGRLAGCVRESDTVARFGSDEFVLVCSGLQHASDAVAVADKVRHAVCDPFVVEGKNIAVTACIGVSIYPDSSESPETLLAQADVAMFRAKGQGRNRVQVFRVEVASALNPGSA